MLATGGGAGASQSADRSLSPRAAKVSAGSGLLEIPSCLIPCHFRLHAADYDGIAAIGGFGDDGVRKVRREPRATSIASLRSMPLATLRRVVPATISGRGDRDG